MAEFTLSGKDAQIIEDAARALCHENGGNCITAQGHCKGRGKCRLEGWSSYTDDVETVLKVIREKHSIAAKKR
jgi:hypothetical protein